MAPLTVSVCLCQSTWKQAAEHGVSPSLSPTWKVALLSDGSVSRHLQLMTGQPVELVRPSLQHRAGTLSSCCMSSAIPIFGLHQRQLLNTGLPRASGHWHGDCRPAGQRSRSPWTQVTARGLSAHTSDWVLSPSLSLLSRLARPLLEANATLKTLADSGLGHPCIQVNLTVNGRVLVSASSWWNSAQMSQYLGEAHKPIWINLSSNRTELYREITQIYCGHSPDLERCAAV